MRGGYADGGAIAVKYVGTFDGKEAIFYVRNQSSQLFLVQEDIDLASTYRFIDKRREVFAVEQRGPHVHSRLFLPSRWRRAWNVEVPFI
jgi:hypothetical protein